jgi:hypothetical protein
MEHGVGLGWSATTEVVGSIIALEDMCLSNYR